MFKANRVFRFIKSIVDSAKNEVRALTLSVNN